METASEWEEIEEFTKGEIRKAIKLINCSENIETNGILWEEKKP